MFPALTVIGTSVGLGIIVYQFIVSERGLLKRMEVGRSQFRSSASPSVLPYVAASLRHFFIFEAPLYVNVSAMMGLTRFDSEDDDEGDMSHIYALKWLSQARGFPLASLLQKQPCRYLMCCRPQRCFPPSSSRPGTLSLSGVGAGAFRLVVGVGSLGFIGCPRHVFSLSLSRSGLGDVPPWRAWAS